MKINLKAGDIKMATTVAVVSFATAFISQLIIGHVANTLRDEL